MKGNIYRIKMEVDITCQADWKGKQKMAKKRHQGSVILEERRVSKVEKVEERREENWRKGISVKGKI